MRRIHLFRNGFVIFVFGLPAVGVKADLNHLVPVPVSLTARSDTFTVPRQVMIFSDGAVSDSDVCWVKKLFDQLHVANPSNYDTAVHVSNRAAAHVRLSIVSNATLGTEGYLLTITRDSIAIAAQTATGQFYAIQTIRQMLPPQIENGRDITAPQLLPGCTIVDYPRFVHRGFMMDVARHFYDMAYLRQLVDRIALFKGNILHLHLSDDQGWRIQVNPPPSATGSTITAYNNLTAVGGNNEVGEACPDCYFTQQQMRDSLVNYALERRVNIIPEIDMPGHVQAAIAAFARAGIVISASCFGPCTTVYQGTSVGGSSLTTTPMTAVVDTFVRTVWTQMAAVFPYEYLHMGGDEVGGTGYGAFVRRTEAIINSLGRKMIGWDAIYDSVANPTTMTQTWKPNNDHPNSIYSWQNYLYFDYDPVALPISEVYRPCVGVTNHYGIESALWTEHISPANGFADRNMWPRQAAAAEAAWSAYEDWATSGNTLPNFYVRMQPFGCRFTCLGMSTWNQDTVIHWQGCPAESSTVATNALSNYDWKLIPVSAPTGTMAMHSRMPASPNLNMLAKAGYKSVDIRGRVVSVRDLGASNGPGNARGIHFVVDTKGCLAQKVVVK